MTDDSGAEPAHNEFPPLVLKRREERRLRGGHLWIFSNEVDTAVTPLRGFKPGTPVTIQSARGKFVGFGYVNPRSLISARIVSRNPQQAPGPEFFESRLRRALALRERLYPAPFYRLVYGESDGLPGLVIDRFGDVLVAQITTAGMEWHKDALRAACETVLAPAALVWRNDSGVRDLEGLPRYVETAFGDLPETIDVPEHGAIFTVPMSGGQKTGWYFDQRENRSALRRYASRRRVLDVFSYLGAWGIQAARAGASEVICIDSSEQALELLGENARRNEVEVRTIRADAFQALKDLREQRERFDVVVLDPPAFIKRRKDFDSGKEAYRRLNQNGMRLLAEDGILVTSSCSYHFSESDLIAAVQVAARRLEREVQILEIRGQGPDHPVHPAIPESRYLNTLICRVRSD